MAKLTDEQLMILDNLIYLREIANGSDDLEIVADFINYIKLPDGSISVSTTIIQSLKIQDSQIVRLKRSKLYLMHSDILK